MYTNSINGQRRDAASGSTKSGAVLARSALAVAILAALGACGGGEYKTQTPAASMPQDNATMAADATAAVAIDALATANGSMTGDVVPPTAVSAVSADIGAFAATTTVRFCSSSPINNVDTGNGDVTTVVNDTDPAGPSTGDVVTVTFNNCVQAGRTINGNTTSTVVTLTGTPGTGVFTLDTSRSIDLTIATAAGATIKNKGTSSVNETSDGVKTTRTVQGTSALDVSGTAPSTSTQEYNISGTTDAAANTFSQTATLKSTSTASGSHEVTTPTPISGTIGATPTAGVINIKHTAPDGAVSIIKVTLQTDGTVLLETDSNGDGVVDTTTTRSWFGLIGLGVGPAFGFGPGLGQSIGGGPAVNRPGSGTAGPGLGGPNVGGGGGIGRLPLI